jgi:formylglycine-generating enzyme required for sulfatase activity
MWWMIGIGLSVASSTNRQDGENDPQLRSHLGHILNVPQRVRLRCGHRLRPCWVIVLTILHTPWKSRFSSGVSCLALVLIGMLACTEFAQAQLELLRKNRPVEQAVPPETPMVEIPAGEFAMGSDGVRALEDERPVHRVWLERFSMDLHEVATAQYAEFLTATQRPAPWQWNSVDLLQSHDRPVIGVDWSDADAYCRWKGKRLPTEAEWEKSARGTEGWLYPWGNQFPRNDLANFALGARFSYSQVLMPVQSYEQGKSPYGLYHMAGNVWEWVQDWYAVNYYEISPERNPQGPEKGQFKVLRGGSWSDLPKYLLTYGRFKLPPETRNSYIGFRCAKS